MIGLHRKHDATTKGPAMTIATAATVEDGTAALQREIDALRMELAGARNAHRNDIAYLGNRLLQLAEEQDWCETFDREVVDANKILAVKLPLRSRTYTVCVTGTVTVSFSHNIEVEVGSGESVGEATDEAMGDLGMDDLNLDTYEAKITWEVEDYNEN
jgi:hypothetical protein